MQPRIKRSASLIIAGTALAWTAGCGAPAPAPDPAQQDAVFPPMVGGNGGNGGIGGPAVGIGGNGGNGG